MCCIWLLGSLWIDEFQMIELDEIMRQRGDSTFSELLCRVRTNSCTSADIDILRSREIATDTPTTLPMLYMYTD